jgi:BASS family bile acid:Na+ symporter
MFENLRMLDSIRLNIGPVGLLVINLSIAVIFFGVSLDFNFKNFRDGFRFSKSIITGLVSQHFLLPLVTFILVKIINPPVPVALGMILVAACPGGIVSKFIINLARGNVTLSVAMTNISSVAALIFTPLNYLIWSYLYVSGIEAGRPVDISFLPMFSTVLLLAGIPMAVGFVLSNWVAAVKDKIYRPVRIFSFMAFVCIIITAFASNFDHFLIYVPPIFFLVLLHNGSGLLTGWLAAVIMKRPVPDQRSISIDTGIQNSSLALVLIFNPKVFDPLLDLGGMAFIAGWWAIWHILAGLALAGFWSRKPVETPG